MHPAFGCTLTLKLNTKGEKGTVGVQSSTVISWREREREIKRKIEIGERENER